jgi:hypothetical protein
MSMGTPIPVRFTVLADHRLSAIALRNGVSKAELIRLAVDNFLREIEHSGSMEFIKRIDNPVPMAAEEVPERTIKTTPVQSRSYKNRRRT